MSDPAGSCDPGGSGDPAGSSLSQRLVSVTLDEASIVRVNPDGEHERALAVHDILDRNSFSLPDRPGGPYRLHLAVVDGKLAFEISTEAGEGPLVHYLSLSPFRGLIRDYRTVCESYYQSVRTATSAQIEAIDMGRRGLHNEASELLIERLAGKVVVDFDTARRLFTLIYCLHWKG